MAILITELISTGKIIFDNSLLPIIIASSGNYPVSKGKNIPL